MANSLYKKVVILVLCYIILFLSAFFMSGCSPQWHIKRAIHKDPTILKSTSDTIKIVTKQIERDTLFKDSVEVDNEFLNIKVNRVGDDMSLFWKLKSVEYDTVFHSHLIDVYDTVYLKKTRQIIRLEAKQKRLETKKQSKLNLSKQKTARAEERNNKSPLTMFWGFLKIILAFIIGLFIGRFTKQFGIF